MLARVRAHAIALLFVLLIVTAARGATLYVSSTGDDRNPGTDAQPFATMTRARDEVRDRPAQRPIAVIVRGGTYHQTRTLQLDARDSDTHWQAAPAEEVRIDGA